MNFETIIGIEIHCELKTKTKMFSSAPLSFNEVANTCVNEIDLAHPGTLPCVNKAAVISALKACKALNLTIEPLIRFDRKNYYYSDLPKGYQITQQFYPIGEKGFIDIEVDKEIKHIGITRLHMEEDTAKQVHYDFGTMIDFNRAGTPLIEIVSEPDLRSGKEAAAYVEKLRSILYYLDVSDVKMEEGSMRCDVNISLRPAGSKVFGKRCEIKNLNSISNVMKAVDYEVERQSALLLSGNEVKQETRRYDEAQKATVAMRSKEGSVDYKYFPEPNITPIQLEASFINNIINNMPELPDEKLNRLINVIGLNEIDAKQMISTRELAAYFDEVLTYTNNAKMACSWILTELLAYLNKQNKTMSDNTLRASYLADMIKMIEDGIISGKQAKSVFEAMLEGAEPKKYVQDNGLVQLSDESSLLVLINETLDENAQSIMDFKDGKDRATKFLIGQIMKKSKGQANPVVTNKLLLEELSKR